MSGMDVAELSADPGVTVRFDARPHATGPPRCTRCSAPGGADASALDTAVASANAVGKPVVVDCAHVAAERAQPYLDLRPEAPMLRARVSGA